MSISAPSAQFVPLRVAAVRLGVPAAWLKAEATAGRVPHLKVGRRMLFSVEMVASRLAERSSHTAPEAAGA